MATKKRAVAASLVWFEIPADDLARAKKFYRSLFGWKFAKLPAAVNDYWHIDTGGKDASPDGGLMPRMHPQQPITQYISVPSVSNAAKKVEKLGEPFTNLKQRFPAWATSPYTQIRKEMRLRFGK